MDASLDSVILTPRLKQNPQRLPNHREENDALIALARATRTSPDSVLQNLSDTALRLCGAGSSGISLLDPDGTRFHWPAVSGAWAAHVGAGTPRDFGPCGTTLDRDTPQLMQRPERHFTYLESITPPIEEMLLIPFYMEGKAVGTIWVAAHDTTLSFDAEDLRVMTNLATFTEAAIQILTSQAKFRQTLTAHQGLIAKQARLVTQQTAQLVSSKESLADEVLGRAQAEGKLLELSGRLLNLQDEERRRIARDLHDTTGQVLAALAINLSAMQRDPSPKNSSKIAECIDLVASATAEIRSLSYLLHPPLMDSLGLSAAVKDYAEGVERRSGLQITVNISHEINRLAGNQEIVLFRIIQECIGNIHRHSGSTTATIKIFRLGDKIILEVSDHGHGFDADKVGRGVGLRSMGERLRSVDGKLTIDSDSTGTRVKAVLPVSKIQLADSTRERT